MNWKSIATTQKEKYRTRIQTSGSHQFVVDEPISVGGADLGPNPSELVATALASCTSITLKMYADRKGWDLDKIEVKVDFRWDAKTNTTKFFKEIRLEGNLDEFQKQRLNEISAKCPIHKMLTNPIGIETLMV